MEGERILECMKTGADLENLHNAIKAYLSPLHNQKKCSKEKANKYGLFAMKLLHVCVQCWTDCKPNNGMLTNLVMISQSAYSSIVVAKSMMKTSPLALEKLLFHIISQILKKGLVLDGMVFAESLYRQMQGCRCEHIQGGTVDNDYDTVAKQSYNQLWKTCVELEHSQAKQNSVKHPLVLEIRQRALAFLLLSNMPTSEVVDWTLRTSAEFERNSGKLDQTEKWNSLVKFFIESIKEITTNKDTTKDADVSQKEFSSLLRLGIQAVKCCLFLHDRSKAEQILELINKELNQAKVFVDYGSDVFHSIVELLRCLIMFNTMIDETGKHKQLVHDITEVTNLLQNFHNTIEVLEQNMLNVDLIGSLVESLEMVKKYLITTVFNDAKDINPYQESFAGVFVNVLISNVKILEWQQQLIMVDEAGKSKNTKNQLQKNINRQLSVFYLLANILIFQLDEKRMMSKDENCPEEISVTVGMVLQKNVDLVEHVSSGGGGSLQIDEHRWLGCSAFNLGLLFYRRKWYKDAVGPLSLACNQLSKWCTKGRSLKKDNIQEVQLFTRFELLADCQRKAGFLCDSMSSLETLLALMSTSEMLLKSSVELWIKCKRDAVKNGQLDFQTRTVKDAVLEKEMDNIIDNQVTALLNLELNIYKEQRYNTTVEQYAVVCDLLEIYSCEQFALKRSTMLIHLAKLLIHGDFDTEFSSEDCLKEAISLLEQLQIECKNKQLDVNSQPDELADLSFAYFWLSVCQMESAIARVHKSYKLKETIANTCKSNCQKDDKSNESEEEKLSYSSSFTPPTSNLGLENNLMELLNKAVDIWRQLVTCDTLPSDSKQELHHCMKITAAIYHLQDRPLQQVVTLFLASTIGSAEGNSQHCFNIGSILPMLGDSHTIIQCIANIPDCVDNGINVAYQLVAKCKTCFYSGKVNDCVEILVQLTEMELLKRRNRQAYMIKAHVMDLLAGLLNLPIEMTKDTGLEHLCPDLPTPLDLLHDALRLRMSVVSLIFGNDIYSSGTSHQTDLTNLANEINDDGICKWSAIASVLDSLLNVGRQYAEQGCVRQARCYLTEGLNLAQKFMVARRCAEFMLELARVELLTDGLAKAKSNLERSKSFISMDENSVVLPQESGNMAVKVEKSSLSLSSSFSFDVSDDEDNFIQSRKLSLAFDQISNNSAYIDSSPSLKECALILPDYSKHPETCNCLACLDIILHRLDMEMLILQAQICGQEGDLAEQENILRSVKQFYSCVNSKSSMEFQSVCMLGEVIVQRLIGEKQLKLKSKVSESIYQGLNSPLLHLYTCMFSCLVEQERFSLATDYYDKGLELFQTDTFVLSRDINALCKLHFTSALCNLHQSAIENGCQPSDILSHSFSVTSNKPTIEDNISDTINKFEELNMSCSAESPEAKYKRPNWVQLVSTEVRPEMVRNSKSVRADSEKSSNGCDLGIFSDLLDEPKNETLEIDSTNSASTSSKCTVTVKKGSVKYNAKKSKPAKCTVKQGTQLKKMQNDIFTFITDDDDECTVDHPEPKTSRKSRQKTKASKSSNKAAVKDLICCDTTKDNTDGLKDGTAKSQRGKRTNAFQKSKECDVTTAPSTNQDGKINAPITNKQDLLNISSLEETEAELKKVTIKGSVRERKKNTTQNVDEKQPERKSTRGRQKIQTEVKVGKTGGTKKKKQAMESLEEHPDDQIKSSKRRGRKPKTDTFLETMRDDNDTLDDVLMLSTISELSFEEEPLQTSLINDIFKDISLIRNNSMRHSDCAFSVTVEDEMNIEEYSEIEMPRFGSDDDEQDDYISKVRIPKSKQQQKRQFQDDKTFLENDDVINIKKSVASVKDKLYEAYNLVKHKAPNPIFNQICLLLAMCHGDDEPEKFVFYLNKGMANILRHHKLLILGKQHRKLKNDNSTSNNEEMNRLMTQKRILQLNQDSNVSKINKQLPDGWTVVTMAAVSIGVNDTKSNLNGVDCLLISKLVKGYEPLVLTIPVHNDCDGNLLSEIVAEFQAVLAENTECKELGKKLWWMTRQRLDQRMKDLVADIEDKLLKCWKGVVSGQPKNANTASKLMTAAKKLQQKISCKSKGSLLACQILLQSTSILSFQQLTSMLSSITGLQRGSDELLASLELVRNLTKTLKKEPTNHPVILILDKHLQQLPWENISTARSHVVCRIPSLEFLACHLEEMKHTSSILQQGVNVSDAYYVLNPNSDLPNTQHTFHKWFNKDLCWNGVSGQIPNKHDYTSGLTQHDLFVYCGHGNGSQYFNCDDIQKIRCRTLTLLMGCSSGKLKYSGSLEASGIPLDYLLAGCPCLVGNLWDVTDRDIDRFLETLLKSWFTESKGSSCFTDYIFEARNACKLSALIGYAPVTYGLPVDLK